MLNVEVARAVNHLSGFGFIYWGDDEDKRGTYVEYVKRFKIGLNCEGDGLYKLRVRDDGVCYGIFSYNRKERVKFMTKKGFDFASERAIEDCAKLNKKIEEATRRIAEKMVA